MLNFGKKKNTDEAKQNAAQQALSYVENDMVVGIGTGSTTNYFIDLLAQYNKKIKYAVASSIASTNRLQQHGIPVEDLNNATAPDVYIDGADEVDTFHYLIKGGGGAMTREKILATASKKFICIIDPSKQVKRLGKHPLPVEVIPMARSFVAQKLITLGGTPVYREDFITDNGNIILDLFSLRIHEPLALEEQINNIPGVVCHGLFAHTTPDHCIVG